MILQFVKQLSMLSYSS